MGTSTAGGGRERSVAGGSGGVRSPLLARGVRGAAGGGSGAALLDVRCATGGGVAAGVAAGGAAVSGDAFGGIGDGETPAVGPATSRETVIVSPGRVALGSGGPRPGRRNGGSVRSPSGVGGDGTTGGSIGGITVRSSGVGSPRSGAATSESLISGVISASPGETSGSSAVCSGSAGGSGAGASALGGGSAASVRDGETSYVGS